MTYPLVKNLPQSKNLFSLPSLNLLLESFRLWDEDDYEYKIFSILSNAHPWTSVILAGKGDGCRHSTTSFSKNVEVAETS